MKWFKDEYTQESDIALKLLRTLKQPKREYSTTHRIEIAYKSLYKCNMCKDILPPTFQVDHIIELRDGGEDCYENLQALCPNCHATKTRANDLKRNRVFQKYFGKRALDIQENAFAQFHHKSKYFN